MNTILARGTATLLLTMIAATAAVAQSTANSQYDMDALEPPPQASQDRPEPQFRFALLSTLSLPGPIVGNGPWEVGDAIAIDVASGTALASWSGELESPPGSGGATPPASEDAVYAYSPDRKFRCSTLESGWIVGERLCLTCRKAWGRRWKIRAPGSQFARPLVTEKRVFYGTTDNQVYAVKRRSGHRLWVTDVGARVLRPLRSVEVDAPPNPRFTGKHGRRMLELVLVVPDSGESIVALDARTGARVAAYDMPENETLVGGPLVRDGRVAVARQRYDARDAALLMLELVSAQPGQARGGATAPDEGSDEAEPAAPPSANDD